MLSLARNFEDAFDVNGQFRLRPRIARCSAKKILESTNSAQEKFHEASKFHETEDAKS
jgi:hypothetical protein